MENIENIEFGLKFLKIVFTGLYDMGSALMDLLIESVEEMGDVEETEQAA